jgi:hypothetical protein
MVGPGEEVRLVREPANQYDRYVRLASIHLFKLRGVVCIYGFGLIGFIRGLGTRFK